MSLLLTHTYTNRWNREHETETAMFTARLKKNCDVIKIAQTGRPAAAGKIEVHHSLLHAVLHEKPHLKAEE